MRHCFNQLRKTGRRSPLSHLHSKLVGLLIIDCGWVVLLSLLQPIYFSAALKRLCHSLCNLRCTPLQRPARMQACTSQEPSSQRLLCQVMADGKAFSWFQCMFQCVQAALAPAQI